MEGLLTIYFCNPFEKINKQSHTVLSMLIIKMEGLKREFVIWKKLPEHNCYMQICRWPQAVNTHLWLYALRNANDIRNKIADKKDDTSPLERFSTTSISNNTKHFHTFGCPVYTFDNRLASRGKIPPCQSRSRLGINLLPLDTPVTVLWSWILILASCHHSFIFHSTIFLRPRGL